MFMKKLLDQHFVYQHLVMDRDWELMLSNKSIKNRMHTN